MAKEIEGFAHQDGKWTPLYKGRKKRTIRILLFVILILSGIIVFETSIIIKNNIEIKEFRND